MSISSIDTTSFVISGLDSNNFTKITYTSAKKPIISKIPAKGFGHYKVVSNSSYKPEYFFYNDSQMVVKNEMGDILFKKDVFDFKIAKADYLPLGEGAKITYQEKYNNNLHVLQMNGEAYSPFPMQTSGKYTIGNLFNEGDHWLIFSDKEHKLNLYKIK